MKINFKYFTAGLSVLLTIVTAAFLPAFLSRYYDGTESGIIIEEKDTAFEGFKYNLSVNEKLYVLSNALNNRILPQSDYFSAIRLPDNSYYSQTPSYSFQSVYNENDFNDETQTAALKALDSELQTLAEKGIIPTFDFNSDSDYDIGLFAAIDVLEPRKNVTVWQIGSSNVIISHGFIDCLMDAQTHKIYSIAFRHENSWEQYDVDEIARLWAEYLGANSPEPYEPGSPLAEDSTHHKKFSVTGIEGDKTVITLGYYDGINEFFIKVSH